MVRFVYLGLFFWVSVVYYDVVDFRGVY